MTLREKIEVMEAFERGEAVQCRYSGSKDWFDILDKNPEFRWEGDNYRIKPKPKQTVTIEKWLVKDERNDFSSITIIETDNINNFCYSNDYVRVKLLETYEVEL